MLGVVEDVEDRVRVPVDAVVVLVGIRADLRPRRLDRVSKALASSRNRLSNCRSKNSASVEPEDAEDLAELHELQR
jgi:hypothetical protein